MTSQDLRALFDTYDLDGDGRIDKDELRQIITAQRGSEPSERALDATLKALDDNKDGMVDFSEFERAMSAFGER